MKLAPADRIVACGADAPDTAIPIFWRPAALARRLSLSRQSIYNLLARGELESIRIAGTTRIPESSVLAYIERCGR